MKKAFLAFLFLAFASSCFGQVNSNSVTVTVVAPPGCAITVSPSNYYQNTAATMAISVSSCAPASSSCTAKWDTTNLPVAFSNASFAASVSAAMTATTGNHTVVLTCPLPQLSMTIPVTLPNAKAGTAYSADLGALAGLKGGILPYKFSLSSGSLPVGLSLSSSGVVTGIPGGAGSFSFDFTVTDSSGIVARFAAASEPVLLASVVRF